MSLFRVKEFWSNQCSNDEEYDQSSLKVSRINSDSDFVLIGSHSGYLRIYKPTGAAFGENAFYKPNDLYLETRLGDAILQIDVGRLVSGSQSKQIAVLFPRSIGIYSLHRKDGIAEHGTQNTLNLNYEHKLKKSAANFTIGPFGAVQNRDFLCVQSLDGMLTFFEQETPSFSCFLPDFLLPSPIVYVKSFDIFVIVSSDWTLKSYKYKTLNEAACSSSNEEKSTTNLESFWEYNIGENVLDIQTLHDDISRQSHIAVLGEKNLYCFNDYKLRFMKKLDFLPQCFLFYYLDDGKCMFLVVAETSTLLLYQGTMLKWSAKLNFVPIAIARTFFNEINGALVILSEDGYMQFAYLGTEPNLFSAPPLKNQEIDFDKVEDELATLNKIIKSNHTTDINLTNINAERELVLSISITHQIENLKSEPIEQSGCKVSIEIVPNAIFEEVHLSVTVQKPLIVSPSSELYINPIKSTTFTCFVYAGNNSAIPSLELEAIASFITALGVPRICSKKITLPLRFVYESCPPMKDDQFKITLNLSQDSVPLLELFPEFLGENSLSQSSNAIGFKHLNSPIGTILAAKSSKRYRLQSDDIILLNLLVEELVRRLKSHYINHTDFSISYNSPLPINECFKYVNDHFGKNQKVTGLQNELNLLSSQYRLIQKRLVAKFKQKNPTPLGNLDILLQNTYENINLIAEKLEEAKNDLLKSQIETSCALNLLGNLLNLLDDNGRNIESVKATFSSNVYDYENQSWEDVMDASLCYILRTSLAKSEKDKLRAPHSNFEEIKDILKLEKHFVQVLERVSKKFPIEDEGDITPIPAEEAIKIEEEVNDLGTEFATASTRALSARQSLLNRRHKVDG